MNYREALQQLVQDESVFVRLTLYAKIGPNMPYRRIVIRPVMVKGRRHMQFSYFTATQDITKNYRDAELTAKLGEVLGYPFTRALAETLHEHIQVEIGRDGAVRRWESTPRRPEPATEPAPIPLSHDARKVRPFPPDQPDPLLMALEIQDGAGKTRPRMADKLSQINQFVEMLWGLLGPELAESPLDHSPVRLLDCGCGSSYLTLAAYRYLNAMQGIPAHLTGIDTNAYLIGKSAETAAALGYAEGTAFHQTPIRAYQPPAPPDVVIALHACDTATDDALIQGMAANARLIVCAPCCHHHLNAQLSAVAPFRPVTRHGILKERLADLLTDSFRALALRIMGYKTDVVEFISAEHTNRNLMIRAVRRTPIGEAAFVAEYRALRDFWGVTPYLETAYPPFAEVVR